MKDNREARLKVLMLAEAVKLTQALVDQDYEQVKSLNEKLFVLILEYETLKAADQDGYPGGAAT